MVGGFGPGRRARRRAWVGAAVAASALLAMSGSAAAWLPPFDVSPSGNSFTPVLAAGPDGSMQLAWDRDGGGIETAEHVPGGGWSPPLRLSRDGSETGATRIAADPAGDVTAVWIDTNGGLQTVQSASRPRGGAWTRATVATAAVTGVGQVADPAIVLAPDGTATAFWIQPDAMTSFATIRAATRAPGGQWSAPVTVSDTTMHSFAPRAVVARDGTVTVLWYQATAGGVNRVFAASRPAGGAWSTPELLSVNDWAAIPAVTVADDGTVLAAWYARNPSLRNVAEVGVRAPDGTWTVRADVDGGTEAGGNVSSPAVAIRRDGEMTVAWPRTINTWLRIQTITRAAGGATWTEPATLTADGRNAAEPRIGYAPDGVLHAVWRRRTDVNYIVQAVTRAADGSWSEADDLSAASTSSLELSDLSLVFDSDGDPVVSWYRHDGAAGRRVQATADDTHGPRLSEVTVPTRAQTGERLSFSVAQPVDGWSEVGETTWRFGDGGDATATGLTAEHAFSAAGSYEVTVASTDTLGNRSEETRTVTVTDPPRGEDPRREDPRSEDPPVVNPPVIAPPVVTPPAVDPPRPAPPAAGKPRARAFAGCRVPKLTGLTLPAARRRLRAASCRLGKVRSIRTTRRGPARIVRASRRAGTRLKRGAKVDVTLARRAVRR